MVRYVLSICLLFASLLVLGAKGDSMVSGAMGDSTAVAHNVSFGVRTTYGVASPHLQYSFSFPASSAWGKIFPTSYQGVGIAYYAFSNHETYGHPAALYFFQGARIAQFTEKLSLDYEWNFGMSSFWKPSDEVGTKSKLYVNGGLFLSWYPIPEWKFSFGLDYTHFSNGDTALPNIGTDIYGVRLTASRSFGNGIVQHPDKPYKNQLTEKGFLKRTTLDVILCGAWNREVVAYNDINYDIEGKFGVVALHVNPLYKVTHYFSVGPSIDIQYNEGINLNNHVAGLHITRREIKFHRPPLSEQLAAGLSARLEFSAPIFSVNFGLGHNVIYKGQESGGLYYIIALKSFVCKGLFVHTGFKATSTTSSNNLLFGLGWRF